MSHTSAEARQHLEHATVEGLDVETGRRVRVPQSLRDVTWLLTSARDSLLVSTDVRLHCDRPRCLMLPRRVTEFVRAGEDHGPAQR